MEVRVVLRVCVGLEVSRKGVGFVLGGKRGLFFYRRVRRGS